MPQSQKKKQINNADEFFQPVQTGNADEFFTPAPNADEFFNPTGLSAIDKAIGEKARAFGRGTLEIASKLPGAQTVGGAISSLAPVFDFLQRPSFAINKFFDAVSEETGNNFYSFSPDVMLQKIKAVPEAAKAALDELISPKSRLSYSDIIKKNAPDFAKNYPSATTISGFLGDVAFDPTSYLGISTTARGIKVGGRVLSEAGEQALSRQISRVTTAVAKAPSGARTVTQAGREIIEELKALGVEDIKGKVPEIRKLAQTEATSSALGKFSQEGIRETAETQIMRLLSLDPNLEKQLFKSRGLRPTYLGKEIPVISKLTVEAQNKLGLVAAYDKAKLLAKLPGIKKINEIFNRNAGLREEYIDIRNTLENQLDYIADDVLKDIKKTFALTIKQRNDLKLGLNEFKTQLRSREQQLSRELTGQEANEFVETFLHKNELDPDQMAIFSSTMRSYKELQQWETKANLLERTAVSTEPEMYGMMKNLDEFLLLEDNKLNQTFVNSFFKKVKDPFTNYWNAVTNGIDPRLEGASLYGQRMLNARQKIVTSEFNNSLKEMFDVDSLKDLPKNVRDDIKLIGDSVYPEGMNETAKDLLKVFDKLQGWWKFGTTVIKPSFAVKQLPSNTFQSALLTGVKALKMFDPRAGIDAAVLLFGINKVGSKVLPEFIQDFIKKSFSQSDAVLAERFALAKITGEERALNYAKDFVKRTNLGQVYTGTDILDLAQKNGVIRGLDVTESRKNFARQVEQAIQYNSDHNPNVTMELMKWWNHTSIVEDYTRLTQFINSLGIGHSPKQAANLVNETLFDYKRGMSKIERDVIKRVIPFYSFTKMAIPLVLKGAMENPGSIATTQKLVTVLEKYLSSGEELTPDDREIFIGGKGVKGSYLLDQTRIYSGFGGEGKATFNVFNNMTPLDVIKGFQYKPDGSVDFRRTAELNVLTILSPFIKIPLELAADKNFFTDEVLSPEGIAERNKFSKTPKAVGKQPLGSKGRIYDIVSKALPESTKDAIGWEVYKNPKTNKETVYINPYYAYTMQAVFPAMRQFIRAGDADTASEFFLDMIGGIATKEVDLKELKSQQLYQLTKEQKELIDKLKIIKRQQNPSKYDDTRKEYLKLLEFFQQRQKEIQQLQPGGEQQ